MEVGYEQIYVNFSGQYRGVLHGKRGDFMVFCLAIICRQKMRQLFQLYFLLFRFLDSASSTDRSKAA